jgi:transcriptional regulator with XRE-family HTH domain
MRRVRRPPAVITGQREARAIAANLGGEAKATRRRRRLTQQQLGALAGLGQSEISYLERGHGSRTSIETWVAIGIALNRPIAFGFGRDTVQPLHDAGHLDAQELVATVAAAVGWQVSFEAPDDPFAPVRSTDLRLDGRRNIVLVEIWNRMDDLGAASRSSDRKRAMASSNARSLWILVDTATNRAIVRRYPALLRARFPGSSRAWVSALTVGTAPPALPGIIWVDLRSRTLGPLRFPSARSVAPSAQ